MIVLHTLESSSEIRWILDLAFLSKHAYRRNQVLQSSGKCNLFTSPPKMRGSALRIRAVAFFLAGSTFLILICAFHLDLRCTKSHLCFCFDNCTSMYVFVTKSTIYLPGIIYHVRALAIYPQVYLPALVSRITSSSATYSRFGSSC